MLDYFDMMSNGAMYKLRVTDLIPDALTCGGVLSLWSALLAGLRSALRADSTCELMFSVIQPLVI